MSGEHSSGARQQRGPITKTGNLRLRWAWCEAAWRLVRFQPDYRLCKKWREQILNPKLGVGRRQQLIVALARGFGEGESSKNPNRAAQLFAIEFGRLLVSNESQ
jgi:hypothetical protein